MQRKADDDPFDPEFFGIVQKVFVVVVDLDVRLGLRFGFVAVFFHQAGTNRRGGGAVHVAVKCAVLVVGADIGNRDNLDILRVDPADQHASFVACSQDGDFHRVFKLAVAKVVRAHPLSGGEVFLRRLFQKFPACYGTADRRQEILFSDCFLFRR